MEAEDSESARRSIYIGIRFAKIAPFLAFFYLIITFNLAANPSKVTGTQEANKNDQKKTRRQSFFSLFSGLLFL
jgi:hypothetical protein